MALVDGKGIDRQCRTCSRDTHGVSHNIFHERNKTVNIAELLSSSLSLKIDPEDKLPKSLCENCYNFILNLNKFKITALNSDKRLRAYLRKENQGACLISELIEVDTNNYYNEVDVKTEIHSINTIIHEQIKNEAIFVTDNGYNDTIKEANTNYNSTPVHFDVENNNKNDEESYIEINIKEECKDGDQTNETSGTHILLNNHEKKTNISIKEKKNRPTKRKCLKKYIKKETTIENTDNYQQCDICSEKFKNIQSLSAHKRKHTPKMRVLACTVCNKVFKKVSHLKRHEMTHIERSYTCTECSRSFSSQTKYVEHRNMHKGLKAQVCPYCKKSFYRLSNHLRNHVMPSVFLCQTCGKNFATSGNLKQHIRRHKGLKCFDCNLCSKKFVTKGELKTHSLTHTGERVHKCEHCPSSFVSRSAWNKHKLIHVGNKSHQCDSCPMKFLYKYHLKRHLRIHTGERPHKCDICDKAFTQGSDLIKHKRMHLGNNMYSCDQCSQSFRLQTELRRHVTDHYKAQLNADSRVNAECKVNAESSENALNLDTQIANSPLDKDFVT